MSFKNLNLCIFITLLAVNLIFADNANDTETQDKASFPFGFNPFNFFSQFLPLGGSSSRQTRDVRSQAASGNASDTPNNRLFFSLGSTLTTCNYTLTPGLSCVGCSQALTCRANNVGILRRCTLYCNSGRCSFVPGAQCLNSTVTG